MAKTRSVNTKFWKDIYIGELTTNEKCLFIYLITNSSTNISGAYEISKREISFDTGIDLDSVSKSIDKFTLDGKIIYQDGWIYICNFIKHQSLNPKVLIGIRESVKSCPDWVCKNVKKALDSLSIDFDAFNLNLNSNSNLNSKLKEPKGSKTKPRSREQGESEKAKRLFEFWQRKMSSPRSLFSDKRKKLATNALKKYSYRDCLRAIVGCSRSDWHMGRHPENQVFFNEFDLIFRNVEKTEWFIKRFLKAIYSKNTLQQKPNNQHKTTGDIYAERIKNTNNIIANLIAEGERERELEREQNLLSSNGDDNSENQCNQQLPSAYRGGFDLSGNGMV